MLRPLLSITLLLLATAAPLHAASPLTESQSARLGTADDGSTTVDEAAFYALLENVADAPLTKAGAVIPDYGALRAAPGDHRGQVAYIEGRLLTTFGAHDQPIHLNREGYDHVRGLIIQVANLGQTASADDVVIVFLTNPPTLEPAPWQTEPGLLKQSRAPVTLTARLYKRLRDPDRDGEPREYLTFVGHDAALDVAAAGTDPSVRNTIIFAIGIAAMLIYWFWRIATIRRRRSGKTTQVEAYRLRREQRRRERDGEADADEPEYNEPDDLPDDPADAMEALKDHQAVADPPVFTLDDEPAKDD